MRRRAISRKQFRKVGVAGSFQNQMMGNNSTLPVVGEGATKLLYSDRIAYEVIWVNDQQDKCRIREMGKNHLGKTYGDERYEYYSDEDNPILKLEYNYKKQEWGIVYYTTEIIRATANRLNKKYGFGWENHLPGGIKYHDLVDQVNNGIYTKLKLIPGITKRYKNFNKISIIFGIMEEYRDPHF